MSENAPPKASSGEVLVQPITEEQRKFLDDCVYPSLNKTNSNEPLEHIAEVWWNLCQWERQRADTLDSKAQGLLGLSSIAGAVVGVVAPRLELGGLSAVLYGSAILAFLATAFLAIYAYRISDHGGFLDSDVFGALSLFEKKEDPAASTDPDPFRVYLRDTAVQRWLVYRSFKSASNRKAKQIDNAQVAALAALISLVLAVLAPIIPH